MQREACLKLQGFGGYSGQTSRAFISHLSDESNTSTSVWRIAKAPAPLFNFGPKSVEPEFPQWISGPTNYTPVGNGIELEICAAIAFGVIIIYNYLRERRCRPWERSRRRRKQAVSLEQCRIIDLPKIADPRGNLSVIEGGRQIPFQIKRVFYLYDVPGGESRAGHALKTTEQLIIAVSGSFDVILDDGKGRRTFGLNRSWRGVYLPSMVWRELANFSSAGVCLVLASEFYDECDYYRDYQEFLAAVVAR